ncbi:hypothetical protein ABEY65_28315 [Priestia aryabhattai]|uniref:hypothetical protein n=1 Tax=Priestia aryabhattai TaxID=412384 RepID=UPI003D2A4078
MILTNKSANRIGVGKNLLPNFNSPDWFGDDSAVGGDMIVDAFNPHKMQLKLTQSAQGRLIQIPVKNGQAYTISFKNITGLFRLYKGKAKHHDIAITIVQDSVPKPFTFVVDSSYNGYVTLRLTQGLAGTFDFENIQIEEGYSYTAFEPYQDANKVSKKVPRTSLISSDPAKWVQGVRQQSQDISASNYRITFNDAFPKVKPNRTYKLTFKAGYKFGAFLFGKDGKMLLDSKWQYSDYTFTTPSDEGVVVTLNGGLSNDGALTPSRISDSGLMIYDITDLVTRPAKLVPKKNLVPMDATKWEVRPNTTNVKFEDTKVSFQATATYAGVNYYLDPKLYGGKTITFSRGEISTGATATIFYRKSDGGTAYIGLVANTSVKVDVPLGVTELRFYVQNADELVLGKTYYAYDLQAELGTIATPYEDYREVTKQVRSATLKAPYLNYPFSFSRGSIETVNGIQYGQNNPRIVNGGIMIEEGTVNLFNGRNFNSNNGTSMTDLVDRVRLTGLTDGNSSGGYIAGIAVKANTSYTISAKFIEGDSAIDKLNFLAEQSGAGTIRRKPFKIGDRYYMTFTTGASVTKVNICFYLSGGKVGDYFELYKDWLLEEKAYATSPTPIERKAEIASTKLSLDKQAGSIEIEFDYVDVAAKSQYIFDTDSNRWILYKDAWDNQLYVYLDGNSLIQLDKSVLPDGHINAKIVWGNGKVSLSLNGTEVSTGTYSSTNTVVSRTMYIGSRFTGVEHLNNVIYSFTVKDRDGKTTYSI